MKILDCESPEKAYESIETITGLSPSSLNKIFDEFSPKGQYSPYDQLFGVIRKQVEYTAYDRACIFHFTRVPENADFTKGILPLQAALDSIWEFLFTITNDIVSAEEWEAFKHDMNYGSPSGVVGLPSSGIRQYQIKTRNSAQGGPFGLLIREMGFHSKAAGNHDYLAIPEIVEDICRYFEGVHGFNPAEGYMATTRPCIVKFVTPEISREYLSTAFYYLYCIYKGYELNREVSSGFSGRGNAIGAENILNIEWLDK